MQYAMVGYKRFLIITGCILCICVFQTVKNISHYNPAIVGVLYKTMKESNMYGSTAVSFTLAENEIVENHDLHEQGVLPIRKWGCSPRNETPFIFVHNGKAGGGGVRARIAASALDYHRKKWQFSDQDNKHYYPIPSESGDDQTSYTIYKGKFLNSNLPNFRNMYQNSSKTDLISEIQIEAAQKRAKTYEGSLPCAAETPLGGALACPVMPSTMAQHKAYCSFSTGIRCDIVYVGHNFLGSEWHWLPHKYLGNWWKRTPWYQGSADPILKYLDHRSKLWTSRGNELCIYRSTPTRKSSSSSSRASRLMNQPYHIFYNQHYHQCVSPYEEEADNEVIKSVSTMQKYNVTDWSVIHASLPVLRVTVLREPFSWLVSKFFWHWPQNPRGYVNAGPGIGNVKMKSCDEPYQNNQTEWKNQVGWASRLGRSYLYVLCGEDCLVRSNKGHLILAELERQAANNLRQSFAVVGLLHETNTFYDMITARVSYMNMSLNPHVQGEAHSTGNTAEIRRCKKVYQDPDFQEELFKRSPALAALQRVYNVGVEVNQAQKNELQQCGLL